MAAKIVNSGVHLSRKRAHLPAKMAGRNHEVRPVGAWVQPEPPDVHRLHEAVVIIAHFANTVCVNFEKDQFCLKQVATCHTTHQSTVTDPLSGQ